VNTTQKPLLKVGIFSDIQALPSRNDWGMYNFTKALQIYKEKEIDLLVNAGDLAEGGDPETYALYWQLIAEAFPGNMPEHIACEGNHDCNGKAPFKENFAKVCTCLRRECINPEHRVIGGYDFITFATFDRIHYAEEELPALEKALQKASERDPEKPIFVITHFPPSETVSGSFSSGSEGLKKVFQKFPQVVSLSGHTHYPLKDERTIWQGDFTAVETSTLAYGCMTEEKCFNTVNGILPFAREVTECLYLEIFEDRMEFHRYNTTDKKELGPVWNMPLPFVPEKASFTAARAEKRQAPEFGEEAVMLLRYDYGFAYIIFDRCTKGDFAHFYDVAFSLYDEEKKLWEEWNVYRYASDFYRFECNQQDKLYFKLPETLKEGRLCKFRIYGVESFGKRGKPLEMECRLWKGYRFKEAAALYPQE
jgi:Icc-related predicted phosphoesterase